MDENSESNKIYYDSGDVSAEIVTDGLRDTDIVTCEYHVPPVLLPEYIEFIDEQYDLSVLRLANQLLHHEISQEEHARALEAAALSYNDNIRELLVAYEELELSDYDEEHPEEMRRASQEENRRLKERLAELRAQEKRERDRQRAKALEIANRELRAKIAAKEGKTRK